MFNTIVAALGALVLVLALLSKWLEKTPLTPTLLALLCGIVLGPAVLNWIDPAALGDTSVILERAARLTLGIGLVSVALRIPKSYPGRHWREMLVLVGVGMVLMWVISTSLIYLLLGIPFWLAALIGAVVTPTDPIAAAPIVTGPVAKSNLPARLRHAISLESGANDGLSYLFVFLPFLMLTRPPGEALSHWLVHTLIWQVCLATAFGLALGYCMARLLQMAERNNLIMEQWRLIYTCALALFAVGAGRLIHTDEVLIVFAAGMMFSHVVTAEDRKEEELGQEAVNRFFSVPIFALLGMTIPWQGWVDLGWLGLGLALSLMLLRRAPVIFMLKPLLPSLTRRADTLYLGWFAPVAVAAIYYASLMEHRLSNPLIWDVVSLVICVSVVLHGLSAVPLTLWYGRKTGERERLAKQSEPD